MVAVSFTLRLGGKIRHAALGLQVERRQQKGLDDRGRLKFLISPALHGVALQVVHKNAHPALIGIELGGNALFQCHILIHLESLNFSILSVILYPYR